jgi:hypothetical protein
MRSRGLSALLLTCGVIASAAMAYASGTRVLPAGGLAQSIGLFLNFEIRPSPVMLQAMEREVGSIMRPSGLVFSWRETGGSQSGDAVQPSLADLVVIGFKGSCDGVADPPGDSKPASSERILASTRTSEGQVLHFTDVRCNELRRYLAAEAGHADRNSRELLFGRALGRVLAHEMYHIFAATEKHASGGVARACHSRQELTQPVFTFDPREARVLREYATRVLYPKELNPEP